MKLNNTSIPVGNRIYGYTPPRDWGRTITENKHIPSFTSLVPHHQDTGDRGGTGFQAYTDGASRGNPGPAAAAFIIITATTPVRENSRFLGTATNNHAEYEAIIMALTAASDITHGGIDVVSDSELVIRQLNGLYRVRQPHLAELYMRVRSLCTRFSKVTFRHAPRTDPWIQHCDLLCNRALDGAGY